MGYGSDSQVDTRNDNSFYRLSPQATCQYLDPQKSYEVTDSKVVGDYKFHYIPSTLYLDVLVSGKSHTNGKSTGVGMRAPLVGGSKEKFSLFYSKGAISVGVPITEPIPWVGIGNIHIQPGKGVSLGWFSLNSAPELSTILIGSAMVLLQTVIEGCNGSQECVLAFASNLMISATPINTFREVVQKTGIDTSEHACDKLDDQNWYDRCVFYSKSYRRQALFEVASDMVKSGLESLFLDPYIRATLLAERDGIKAEEQSRGIPVGSQANIAGNMKAAVQRVETFLVDYDGWLQTGKGNRPSSEDVHRFMGDGLYLLQKLQISADVSDDSVKVRGGAPIAFQTPEDLARYVETTAAVYNTIAKSQTLWNFIAGEIQHRVISLTKNGSLVNPESLVNQWFKYKNIRSWVYEVSSPNIQALFALRRIHLISLIEKDFKGDKKDSYLKRVRDAKLSEKGNLDKLRARAMDGIGSVSHDIEFLSTTSTIYKGLELLLRLSYEDDPMAEAVGLDFRGLAHTVPIHKGFEILYQLERMERDGGVEYGTPLHRHMDVLTERILKYHGGKIKDEIDEYDSEFKKRCKDLVENFDDLGDVLHDINGDGDRSKLVPLRKALLEICDGGRDGKSTGLDEVIETDKRDLNTFEELFLEVQTAIEVEMDHFAKSLSGDDDEKAKKFEKKANEVGAAANEFSRNFHEIMSYRAGIKMMGIYMRRRETPEG